MDDMLADWVKVGVELSAFIGMVYTAYFSLKYELKSVKAAQATSKLHDEIYRAEMKEIVKELRNDIKALASNENRMDMMEYQINELRHWRGFVNPDGTMPREWSAQGPIFPSSYGKEK